MQKQVKTFQDAFTLVEMLIVMAIFIILFGMGIAAFSGLRDTVLVNENSQNLQQDIRWAQRAAILLKREPDEKWLYGIGIDLRNIGVNGDYTIFKWCSPFNEFADGGNLTNSDFPNYDPTIGSGTLSAQNGNLDTDGDDLPEYYTDPAGSNKCPQTAFSNTPSGELVAIENRASSNEVTSDPTEIESPLQIGLAYSYQLTGQNQASTDNWPAFIVFESITGKTFFYNGSGRLLNYNSDTSPSASPVNVGIGIVTPQRETGTLITVAHDSGKITTRALKGDDIAKLIFLANDGGNGDGTDVVIIQEPGGDNGGDDSSNSDAKDTGDSTGSDSSNDRQDSTGGTGSDFVEF